MELVVTKAQCTVCTRSAVYQELPSIFDNPEINTLIINQLLNLILGFFPNFTINRLMGVIAYGRRFRKCSFSSSY